MTITPYQIVAPLIALIAIIYAWNLVMRHKKTLWEAALWTIFWGAIAYISIEPRSIDVITVATGIQDRENAVVVTFLGILFFLVFYIIVRMEELEQRQTRLVRKMALREADLEKEEK